MYRILSQRQICNYNQYYNRRDKRQKSKRPHIYSRNLYNKQKGTIISFLQKYLLLQSFDKDKVSQE